MNPSVKRTFVKVLLATTFLASPVILSLPTPASAQVMIPLTVGIAPPILQVYAQPPLPQEGYIWTPGYWHWSSDVGYYWVPGAWVLPPVVGVLWTPPYWGWGDGGYRFHEGYWGQHVGFYGGVNYGYGYGGSGYGGGRWQNGGIVYNRTVNNFGSVHVTNTYEKNVTVINDSHISYVGGTGGLHSVPTAEDRQAEHERHISVTAAQREHTTEAARDPARAAHLGAVHTADHTTAHPAMAHAQARETMQRTKAKPAHHVQVGEAHHPPRMAHAHVQHVQHAYHIQHMQHTQHIQHVQHTQHARPAEHASHASHASAGRPEEHKRPG